MCTFRETREALYFAHDQGIVDDEEFLLLYDVNKSKNLDMPYWKYDKIDLDVLSDDECKSQFRFYKEDVYSLIDIFDLPERIVCPNRFFVDREEAVCMVLKRFAYPCRYEDLVARFGRPVPQISMVVSQMVDIIYAKYGHLLSSFNQPWLTPVKLQDFASAIHNKGAALENCWGFIDGTVRPVCRPGIFQRVMYNGHKRVHALKFQSIAAPNGMIANLFGPVEGRRHDSGMLAESGLLPQLEQNCNTPITNQPLCVYGDPAYPLRAHLIGPFKGNITPIEQEFNESMSKTRVAVEWVFGDIVQYFAFLDFKKNLKICLSQVGKMYIVCALLRNALTCKYGNSTAMFFGEDPPLLEEYFVQH